MNMRLMLIPVSLLLSSCILSYDAPEAPPPVHIEALVDFSGSYELRDEALSTLANLLDSLKAGDAITVRSLGSVSHRERGVLLDVAMPETGPMPSRMDVRGMARYQEALALTDSLRDSLKERLGELATMPAAGRTDIVGGIVASTEALLNHQKRQRGILLLFTDGMDNGPNQDLRIAMDLSGIDVVFAHFDPAGTLEDHLLLKDRWTEKLGGDWRARSVRFLTATEGFNLGNFRRDQEGGQEVAS